MRKFLTGIVVIVVVLTAATYLLPSYINSQISSKFQQKLQTEEVSSTINTSPEFMLLFGDVDTLAISADDVNLDKVRLKNLSVNGQNVKISMSDLILARRLVIDSADNLTISCVVDNASLESLLNEKVDGISDITANITPQYVEANGNVSLFGRKADVHIRGNILIEGQNLIFRINEIGTSNSPFSRFGITFKKDIVIAKADSLPMENAKFTKAEQQNGQVLIEATVNK